MNRLRWFVTCCGLVLSPVLKSQELPIKRVVLYKNGVGYFEHVGSVRDNEDVTISFTSPQLNDVLKSLTVLDLNGGRITGVAYGSAASVDRQLGDLRIPMSEKSSLTEFLEALRGARLEIRSGTSVISGRLLSVERKTRIAGGTTLEVDYVSLVTDGGELRTTELTPSFSVRLLDRGLAGQVGHFLDLVSSRREPDLRRIVVSTAGSGERSLYVSYISEVPVWKTTYRIVLGSKAGQSPLLQGWAIVDNTVGEDWDKVALSLVAGAPHSFIQNLSQPYYARRPVVPLPEAANISPQTYQATLIPGSARLSGVVTDESGAAVPNASVTAYDNNGAIADQTTTNTAGLYEFASLPDGVLRLRIESRGFRSREIAGVATSANRATRQDAQLNIGSTAETVTVQASASQINTETSSISNSRTIGAGKALGSGSGLGGSARRGVSGALASPAAVSTVPVDSARASAQAAALAQELGDLFEYKLKEPVTIQKNRSALVPIVQSSIQAEKISIWNEQAGLPRPQRALWLTNTSGLTLDGGSFTVLENETFAGEGIVEPIRPGEKRLVSYATDLALNASSRNGSEQQRVARVRVSHGVMTHESEVREKKTYTFRNEDTSGRTVVVEHPVRPGYELRGDVRPTESTADWMRFRLQIEPKQTASLVVEEGWPIHTEYMLSNITSAQVALFVTQRSINPAIEEALRRVLAQKKVIDDLDAMKNIREGEMEKIFDDQQRLRENIKALKGTPEEKALLERYTRQLNQQESRLEVLRKESEQFEEQSDSAKEALDKMIQELSFDVKL